MIGKLIGLGLGTLVGLQAATQVFAWTYSFSEVLGAGLRVRSGLVLYAPWSILGWKAAFADQAPEALARSAMLILLGSVSGLGLGALAPRHEAPRRRRGWGGLKEAASARLLEREGAILGVLKGRLSAVRLRSVSLVAAIEFLVRSPRNWGANGEQIAGSRRIAMNQSVSKNID